MLPAFWVFRVEHVYKTALLLLPELQVILNREQPYVFFVCLCRAIHQCVICQNLIVTLPYLIEYFFSYFHLLCHWYPDVQREWRHPVSHNDGPQPIVHTSGPHMYKLRHHVKWQISHCCMTNVLLPVDSKAHIFDCIFLNCTNVNSIDMGAYTFSTVFWKLINLSIKRKWCVIKFSFPINFHLLIECVQFHQVLYLLFRVFKYCSSGHMYVSTQ